MISKHFLKFDTSSILVAKDKIFFHFSNFIFLPYFHQKFSGNKKSRKPLKIKAFGVAVWRP